ncbi:MAG: glycosyltransferase family 4 protein, partial [Leptospiraceae bacterium]|nr:glycosyltransferase family 4 protein [Leptospiraceae bacterium]
MKYRCVQIAPGLNRGDAITNEIEIIHNNILKISNYFSESAVVAEHIGAGIHFSAMQVNDYVPADNDVLIYHYGIASDVTRRIQRWSRPVFLIYHNVTPAKFFAPYDFSIAGRLDRARRELLALRRICRASFADSDFNARELRHMGFHEVRIKPVLIPFSPAKKEVGSGAYFPPLDLPNDREVILFVGRLAPNKAHAELIKIFKFIKMSRPDAILVLAGSEFGGVERYREDLLKLVVELELERDVVFTGYIGDDRLYELYHRARLFLCASRHEGFCVPLLEAMEAGLPVLAFDSGTSAVRETMQNSGVLYITMDYVRVAEMAVQLVSDDALRRSVIDRQTERLR